MAEEKKSAQTGRVQTDVGLEELRPILNGAAVFTNKFYATNTAAGLRITFMEAMPELDAQFRCAVLIGYQDAIALREVLKRQLAEIEQHILQAEEQSTSAQRDSDAP